MISLVMMVCSSIHCTTVSPKVVFPDTASCDIAYVVLKDNIEEQSRVGNLPKNLKYKHKCIGW